jgi:tRNA (guanine-N1)-methyltransferase
MLMMAQPVIDAVNFALQKIVDSNFHIIFASPSVEIWDQKFAHKFSKIENLIFVCGRYE